MFKTSVVQACCRPARARKVRSYVDHKTFAPWSTIDRTTSCATTKYLRVQYKQQNSIIYYCVHLCMPTRRRGDGAKRRWQAGTAMLPSKARNWCAITDTSNVRSSLLHADGSNIEQLRAHLRQADRNTSTFASVPVRRQNVQVSILCLRSSKYPSYAQWGGVLATTDSLAPVTLVFG